MLNIDFNLNVKKVGYPIFFTNNTCTKCAGVGTLKFVDIFGNTTDQEIHALERIQCTKCGAKYGINWEVGNDGKMHPMLTDYTAENMFNNMLNHWKIKRNHGSKVI